MRSSLFLLVVLALTACPGGETPGGELDRPHPMGGQSWTVLVYMTADNDLEPFALQDLTEMMSVGSSTGFNLVVQVDRADGYANDGIGGLPDFTDTKRVLVQQGQLQVVQEMGEMDMAATDTLSDFVSWGLKTYPADRTMLVFWDHGGGWTGFGVDEASGHRLLKLPQIEAGVAAGRMNANMAKPFTIIGFDACLMATYETALTLAPHAEYLLASEETEPGHGWDWSAMQILANDTGSDPVALGKNIIAGFEGQAQQAMTVDNITLSLTDLYRMGTLKKAVEGVVAAYGMGSPSLATALGRGQEKALKFGDAPDPSRATNMVDLQHFITLAAAEDSTLGQAQQALQTAISQAVIDFRNGAARSNAKGLAIYFPPNSTYYNADYDAVTAAEGWRGLLKSYFGGSGSSGGVGVPTFTDANKTGTIGFDGNNDLALVGHLAVGSAASVARSTMYFGIIANSTFIVLGDLPATLNGDTAQGSWNTQVLSLTQGTTTGYAYTSLTSVDATRFALNMLFSYRQSSGATAQSCIRQMVFSSDSQGNVTLSSDTYYVESSDTFGELSPVAGSTLTPLLRQIDGSGNDMLVEGGEAFVTSAGTGGKLVFAFNAQYDKLNSGTAVFELITVENAAGQGDAVSGSGTLP